MENISNKGDFMTTGEENNMSEEYQPHDKENENNSNGSYSLEAEKANTDELIKVKNQAKTQDIEASKNTTRDEQNESYKVGYKKPPLEHQWKKGCKSPNPKGRPKKATSLRQAIQFAFNKLAKTTDENGKTCKKSYLEILGLKTVQDAIKKDGPTRRLLMSKDFVNLAPEDPELEYPENKKEIAKIEKEYGEILRQVAGINPQMRKLYIKYFAEVLRDVINTRERNEQSLSYENSLENKDSRRKEGGHYESES